MSVLKLNNRLPYNPKFKDRTRELRKNMTEPEKKLRFWFLRKLPLSWQTSPVEIKTPSVFQTSPIDKKLPLSWQTSPSIEGDNSNDSENRGSFRVYKQRPIDNFIVDFYIPKLKLVIEIDWDSHFTENWIEYDKERTAILEWLWLKIIRFTNPEIMNNFNWVCEVLLREFDL